MLWTRTGRKRWNFDASSGQRAFQFLAPMCHISGGPITINHSQRGRADISELVKYFWRDIDRLSRTDRDSLVTEAHLTFAFEDKVDLFLVLIVPGHLSTIRIESHVTHREIGRLDWAGPTHQILRTPTCRIAPSGDFCEIRDNHVPPLNRFEYDGRSRTIMHARKEAVDSRGFYGWRIVATEFITLGIALGIPYYNLPFFYDYFQHAFHWSLSQITLGFPVAALLTVWVGPLIIPRFSPRKLIVVGTALTAISFFGFGSMKGALSAYFVLYFIYTVGYIISGPIPHQILVSYWFHKARGRAMAIVYVGVGLLGGLGSFFVRSFTERQGFQAALIAVGALMFITWPLAIFSLKDRPEELNQNPDGAAHAPADTKFAAQSFGRLLKSVPFWLLVIGSICSISSIGAINMHMKFVFRDQGFTSQKLLNATWTYASVLILWSSIVGRLSVGYLADMFSKKRVMAATYFVVGLCVPLLLAVRPDYAASLPVFAVIFGFSMGADYILIPLMAAEQFGVNTLARAMGIILPLNTIGQTWCPYLVSVLRQHSGSYLVPLAVVFAISMLGACAIALLPRHAPVLELQLASN